MTWLQAIALFVVGVNWIVQVGQAAAGFADDRPTRVGAIFLATALSIVIAALVAAL